MDYTLLTAVHPRTTKPTRMNAKQEQAYYECAAARQWLPEKLLAATNRVRRLAAVLFALAKATGRDAGHGMTARNALH